MLIGLPEFSQRNDEPLGASNALHIPNGNFTSCDLWLRFGLSSYIFKTQGLGAWAQLVSIAIMRGMLFSEGFSFRPVCLCIPSALPTYDSLGWGAPSGVVNDPFRRLDSGHTQTSTLRAVLPSTLNYIHCSRLFLARAASCLARTANGPDFQYPETVKGFTELCPNIATFSRREFVAKLCVHVSNAWENSKTVPKE